MTTKQRALVICLTALAAMGCEPIPDNLFTRTFVIGEGQHYATPFLAETLQSDQLTFFAEFDASAVYDLGDRALQSNKNKLFGFSDSNSLHHENSARFAWQWFDNRLEIFAYCYVNGERKEVFVGVVAPGERNRYEIELTDHAYVFYLNNERKAVVERGSVAPRGLYYLLYPYFGGSVPAPHDITIRITRAF